MQSNSNLTPLVSIIIPVYNVEKYLRECLDSVDRQTLRNIEVICVNDGSPDNSLSILREYEAKDQRFHVIDQKNQGVSIARNNGFAAATGKFTYFVDPDDWIVPQLCEKIVAEAEKTNADMTFLLPLNGRTVPQRKITVIERLCNGAPHDVEKFSMTDNIVIFANLNATWMKLWKTAFLRQHSLIYPPGIRSGQDSLLHWHACLCKPVFAFVPEKLYFYRTNNDSVLNNPNSNRGRDCVKGHQWLKTKLIEFGQYHGIIKDLFLRDTISSFYRSYSRTAPQYRSELLTEMKAFVGDDERAFVNSKNCRAAWRDWYWAYFSPSAAVRIRKRVKYFILNKMRQDTFRRIKRWLVSTGLKK